MTENKRFHFGYVLGDTGLIDEQSTEHKWFIENCCSVSDLKKNWKTVCDKLNEVAEENEQLKQRNDRQAKQLDRLYSLIEEKDWRALNDILDDFKRCEEQLQREWGTYGDLE